MSKNIAAIGVMIIALMLPMVAGAAENGIFVPGNIVLEKDGNGVATGVVFSNGDVLTAAPKDGKSLLNGIGAPSIVANPGDFYLDTANSVLYGPYAGSWGSGVSLVGKQGIQGPAGASPFILNGVNAVYTAGSVGIGVSLPSNAAALDVTSTSKGFLPPRMSTIQRNSISAPPAGLMVYNTDTKQLNIFNGSSWNILAMIVQDILGGTSGTQGFNANQYYFTGYLAQNSGTISSVDIRVNSTGNFQLLVKDGTHATLRSGAVVPVTSTGVVTVPFPPVTINVGEYVGFRYTGTTTVATAASNMFFGPSDPPTISASSFQVSIMVPINHL